MEGQTGLQVEQGSITQTPPTMMEENNTPAISTENVTDSNIENTEGDLSGVKSDGDINTPDDKSTDIKNDSDASKEITLDEAKTKLKEYELREQEALDLRARLNIDTPTHNPHLDTLEATVDNMAQQSWIKLCNEFGVDYTPEGIEKSQAELLEKDPKAFYKFQALGERLYQDVETKKAEIHATRVNHEIESFVENNKPILESSPVVSQLIGDYIQDNIYSMRNPSQELNSLMESIKMIYNEAIEVGKYIALHDKVANDTSSFDSNNSIATSNTSNYPLDSGKHIFTRAEISAMDLKTFAKHEKEIANQMVNGLIK